YWAVVGRLAPGVRIGGARAEFSDISAQLARDYPQTQGRREATLVPFGEHLRAPARSSIAALLAAVVFVLLIACANVAGLLGARGASRRREFGGRAALGASRSRLIRQTFAETTLLALAGCLAGVAVARIAVDTFVATGPAAVRQLNELAI